MTKCHSLPTLFYVSHFQEKQRKAKENLIMYISALQKPMRKGFLRGKPDSEFSTWLRQVPEKWCLGGTMLRQYFPKRVPEGVERCMKECSVVKKVWEMLRLAKSDGFLHWRALDASAASAGRGGRARVRRQAVVPRPRQGALCPWRIIQVPFSLETLGNAHLISVYHTLKLT